MKRIFTLFLAALMLFSLCACGNGAKKETEKKLSPYEKLMARYSEIANEQAALAETIAKTGDMTISGKYSRLAIDLTDIASAITKAGENISDEDFVSLDAKLEKCKTTLEEIKTLLEE